MSNKAMVKREEKGLQKVRTTQALQATFDDSKHIILAPNMVMGGGIPEGMILSVREVKTDMDDTYWMPANKKKEQMRGLPKSTLMQIGNAAGLEWENPTRTDDRKHPHYCEWTAAAKMRQLDGSEIRYADTKCVDLREDAGGGVPGKDYEEMVEAAKASKPPRDPTKQIREARKFISEICLSKAMNRVIADATGIKRSYPEKQLREKTFIVAKLAPDPSDPEAKRAMIASSMGAAQALFGTPQLAAPEKEKTIDAEYEEADPQGESIQESEPEPESEPQQEQEQPGTREVMDLVKECWMKAHGKGMTPDVFKKLCAGNTGKSKKEEMTISEARQLEKAINNWMEQTNAQQEVPI